MLVLLVDGVIYVEIKAKLEGAKEIVSEEEVSNAIEIEQQEGGEEVPENKISPDFETTSKDGEKNDVKPDNVDLAAKADDAIVQAKTMNQVGKMAGTGGVITALAMGVHAIIEGVAFGLLPEAD